MKLKCSVLISFTLLYFHPAYVSSQGDLKNLEVLYTIFHPDFPESGLNALQIGENVCHIGDVNGDGYDDWATGLKAAIDYGTGLRSGTVHVYFGGEIPESQSAADLVIGGWPNIYSLGSKIAGAGDVNNDGFDDLLVRYIERDDTFTEIWPRVSLYLGGDPFDTQPDFTFSGKEGCNNLNYGMISGAGDVNGDGFDDIIIGAPTKITGPDTAHAYLYLGGDPMDVDEDLFFTGNFYPPGYPNSGAGSFAFEVSGAGDMNKDGYDDLLINGGASTKMYLGGSKMDNIADVLFEIVGAGTGAAVSGAGDVNNDGYDDIVLGAKVAGNAYICFGGETIDNSPDVMMTGYADWDYYGRSVSGAGDVNGDGIDDVIVGSDVDGMGKAWLYHGGSQMDSIRDALLYTNIYGDRFGYTVSGGGDLDGDGFCDVIVGGIGDYTNFTNDDDGGAVYLFYGEDSLNNEPEAVFNGITGSRYFGHRVSNAGDVNNDGYPDLIVGNGDYKPLYHYIGRAFVYHGTEDHDAQPDITLMGTHDDWHYNFGGTVRCAGDVNNDGYSDLFVGETNYNTDNNWSYLFFGGETMDSIPDIVFPFYTRSFTSPGDLNNDGIDDIVLCYDDDVVGGNEKAFLYFGGESMDYFPDLTIDSVFWIVEKAGDINGDGFQDLMIMRKKEDNSKTVDIFFGGSTVDSIPDVILTEDFLDHYRMSSSMAGGDDINNDGFDDIVLTMINDTIHDGSKQKVCIFYGGESMDNVPDIIMSGDEPQMYFGNTAMVLPDLNADGFAEVLINEGKHIDEYPGLGLKIFFGGDPMDTVPDVFMAHPHGGDLSVYSNPESDTVRIIAGYLLLNVVMVYTNANLLPEPVFVPDTAFLYALIDEGVDVNGDSLISYAEAEAVTSLEVNSRQISDMTGLEAFINLDTLNCGENQLTTLDVSNNTALKDLACYDNQLISLDVSENTALIQLRVSSNQFTGLDITNNTTLTALICDGNPLTSLDISKSTVLEYLNISLMPTLLEVCVWGGFSIDVIDVDTTGSPNVCFETDCNGVCSTTGVDRTSYRGFSIYPNPTNSIFTIETTDSGLHSIEITSLNGQLLYRTQMEGTMHQIDLSSFQKGVYFITVRSRDQEWTERINKL